MASGDERTPRLSLGKSSYSWEEENAAEEAKKQICSYTLRNVRRSSLPDLNTNKIITEILEKKKSQPNQETNQEQLDQLDMDNVILPEENAQEGKKRKREKDPDLTEEEQALIDKYTEDMRFLELNINRSKVGATKYDAVRSRLLLWVDKIGRLKGENETLKGQINEQKEQMETLRRELIEINNRATKYETLWELANKKHQETEGKHEGNERKIMKLLSEIEVQKLEMKAAEHQLQALKDQNKSITDDTRTRSAAFENLTVENARLLDLIVKLREDINKKQEKTGSEPTTIATPQPTYAEMMGRSKPRIPEKTWDIEQTKAKLKPVVFIKPGEGETVKQLEKKFTDSVDPSKSKIRATIRTTRNGLMVIGEDQEEIKKIRNLEEVKKKFKIEEQPKQKPALIIYGVHSEMSGEEIVEKLIQQNIKDETLLEEAMRETKPKFRTGPRKQERDHIVLETTNKIRLYLVGKSKIFINFERFAIKDFLSIPKCYRCITYGHVEKHCRAPKQLCKYCGKDSHKFEACPDSSKDYCVPCMRSKRECKAMNEDECPSYKAAKDRAISRINYG